MRKPKKDPPPDSEEPSMEKAKINKTTPRMSFPIFTFIFDFNSEDDIRYINNLKNKFEKTGGKFFLIELEADLKVRLERNISSHRLEAKSSKRNIKWSNKELLDSSDKYRMNSKEGEVKI